MKFKRFQVVALSGRRLHDYPLFHNQVFLKETCIYVFSMSIMFLSSSDVPISNSQPTTLTEHRQAAVLVQDPQVQPVQQAGGAMPPRYGNLYIQAGR